MTEVLTVQEGQVWTNGSSNWTVIAIGSGDRITIRGDDGYVSPYRTGHLLNHSGVWTLIEDPDDSNLSEFVVQRCSECHKVQGVVSREDIRSRKARRTTICPDCDLVDPYDEDEDEYYRDEE